MYIKPIQCPKCLVEGEKFFFKSGYYYTKHNYQPDVPRYTCLKCGAKFSSHSDRTNRGQRKPELNEQIFMWICSSVPMSRITENLEVNRRTVERKVRWLAEQAKQFHKRHIESGEFKTSYVQFDELETFEHTPMKPLSVAIAVLPKTGQIIDMRVATMNCHGPLAFAAKEKYGVRPDTRNEACSTVMKTVARVPKSVMDLYCFYEWVRHNSFI